jgi:hypothetical protein
MPELRVLELIPLKPTDPYVYLTCGASEIDSGATHGLEFFLFSRSACHDNVELLSLVAYMHRDPNHHLNVGHTMNLGRPWQDYSHCDRLLVSLPYITGGEFEFVYIDANIHARFLWIIPITAEEESFCHREGLEALEARFEEVGMDFTDPKRESVTLSQRID